MILQLVVCVALVAIASVKGRSVTVDVKAPWNSHPVAFLAEISEFLYDQSPAFYWQYTDLLCKNDQSVQSVLNLLHGGSSATHADSVDSVADKIAELQAAAYEATSGLIPSSMQTLLTSMIGLGHYAPAIQFFETLAEQYADRAVQTCGADACAFAVLQPGKRIVCAAAELIALVNAAASDSSGADAGHDSTHSTAAAASWDHTYARRSASPTTTPIAFQAAELYGIPGSPVFCALHTALAMATEDGSVGAYTVRPHFSSSTIGNGASSTASGAQLGSSTRLQGYGVLLDIKNMEYKNVDDANTKTSAAATGTLNAAMCIQQQIVELLLACTCCDAALSACYLVGASDSGLSGYPVWYSFQYH
jgi:hypothetical protein